MSDVLAIFGPPDGDAELIEEIGSRSPRRVTVLVEGAPVDWAADDSPEGLALRDRLVRLLQAIETRTGATVVGLAGDADQLQGWRFDRVLRSGLPVAA